MCKRGDLPCVEAGLMPCMKIDCRVSKTDVIDIAVDSKMTLEASRILSLDPRPKPSTNAPTYVYFHTTG